LEIKQKKGQQKGAQPPLIYPCFLPLAVLPAKNDTIVQMFGNGGGTAKMSVTPPPKNDTMKIVYIKIIRLSI